MGFSWDLKEREVIEDEQMDERIYVDFWVTEQTIDIDMLDKLQFDAVIVFFYYYFLFENILK